MIWTAYCLKKLLAIPGITDIRPAPAVAVHTGAPTPQTLSAEIPIPAETAASVELPAVFSSFILSLVFLTVHVMVVANTSMNAAPRT